MGVRSSDVTRICSKTQPLNLLLQRISAHEMGIDFHDFHKLVFSKLVHSLKWQRDVVTVVQRAFTKAEICMGLEDV